MAGCQSELSALRSQGAGSQAIGHPAAAPGTKQGFSVTRFPSSAQPGASLVLFPSVLRMTSSRSRRQDAQDLTGKRSLYRSSILKSRTARGGSPRASDITPHTCGLLSSDCDECRKGGKQSRVLCPDPRQEAARPQGPFRVGPRPPGPARSAAPGTRPRRRRPGPACSPSGCRTGPGPRLGSHSRQGGRRRAGSLRP